MDIISQRLIALGNKIAAELRILRGVPGKPPLGRNGDSLRE